MRRLSVGLLLGCWAVLGCRTTAVPELAGDSAVVRGATPADEADHLRLAAEHLDRADEAGAVPHLKAHLRRQPDAIMVRAYLGELLLKMGNVPESKLHFEQFAREATDGSGPAPAFSVTDRDFSFRSLRGNAVLRWEWRAGSTMYLVWQQNRSRNLTATGAFANEPNLSRFDPYLDAKELFGLRPDNIFQVKVSYWLNP